MQSRTGFGDLFNGFASMADMFPGGEAAAAEAREMFRDYDPTIERNNQVYTVGWNYDPGEWFVMGELVRTQSEGMFGSSKGGYVSGGYRWNSFTPYLTYGRVKSDKRHDDGVPLDGLPPAVAGFGMVVNGVVAGVINGNSSQQTLSTGVRWDFAPNFDFKAQYDYIDLDPGSIGQLSLQQSGFV